MLERRRKHRILRNERGKEKKKLLPRPPKRPPREKSKNSK
jgi:hypothetical protein